MNKRNKTDWERVKADAKADKPVPYEPETDLYDPNAEKAVEQFWAQAKVTSPGRPRVAVKHPTLNMLLTLI
ncbi:hypothetical protein H0484_03925 [Pusillimonas sp. CC-YST705]|uniref:Uncharacterized protein n=1 Tax=Mesopusillimonas faecipullorum TaxID=2755040 RepID=A0ABS8CA64_9BURK|nr:hypothetical protein [Mesopusillimonas faecipullorum]MCB5362903.1 hypothetical protein [Mesopusillimonas faecipullorum]